MTAAGRGVVGEGQFGQFRAKRAAVSDALDDMAYGALLNKERRELPSNLQTLARFGEMLSAQCSQIEARAVRPWEANGQLEPEQVKRATVQLVAEYLVTVSPMTAQLAALISIAAGIEPPTSKDNELELSLRKSVWHARLEAARKRITPGFRQARRQTTARERIQGPLFDEKTWRRWKQDPANADFRKSFLQWVRDPSNVEYLRILISKLKDTAPQH